MIRDGKINYLVGIDEVGRGPLAGPITICAVCVPKNFPKSFYKNVRDSKKLMPLVRESWDKKIRSANKEGRLKFSLASVGSELIDRKGVTNAINLAIKRVLKKLDLVPEETLILLDGSLKAPKEFVHQETIIGGDDKIPVISLASIVAKVARDKRMCRFAKLYPQYNFHIHKGYGTRSHYSALLKCGVCPIHRQLFLRKFFKNKEILKH